ncbi:glycoside hydrolase family 13 protein [Salinibius halmophilus]|uniref:glycoside hydrolase family 13 protein n=1 Tax=Salinibius halmophilus TaxID=1853216 RepID=UPI000E66E6DB|nr:alpha-glucosidase [Salinibius halmophilus]
MSQQWWHSATVYQIYPRSFQDSNGDGMGDIPGIISRLDYLCKLGISIIWLCPVYASPMADNGYDISDYCAIAPEFGSMEDMQALIKAAKARGIHIIMDLVLNHTSDQHEWFQQSRSSKQNPYRDFYIWRQPDEQGQPPQFNPTSYFGGSMWTLDEQTGEYYFHQFASAQPDLNWRHPDVQQAMHKIINWWLQQGIAGFRLDVVDLIGKDIDAGILANGPHLHKLLQNMNQQCFAPQQAITVGEVWSATPETAKLMTRPERGELSMLFQFEHILQLHHPEHGKWRARPFNLIAFKQQLERWQQQIGNGWIAQFWGNHDLPRAVSTFGHEGDYREPSAKALAMIQFALKGTPYIYQGEEIGMTNVQFEHIDDYRDIETLNHYHEKRSQGWAEEDIMTGIFRHGRDNARTPMQWSASAHAGFSKAEPWIGLNDNFQQINVGQALVEPDSILYCYQQLIALRKTWPVLVYGEFFMLLPDDPQLLVFKRHLAEEAALVVVNLSAEPAAFSYNGHGEQVVGNYGNRQQISGHYQPYEAVIFDLGD